jgi:hypothetical protein
VVGWLLVGAIVIAPTSAVSQDRDPTPSAHELWESYPLHEESATATPTEAAAGAESSGRRASAPTRTSDGAGGTYLLLAAVGALLALAGIAVVRRRSRAGVSTRGAPVLLAATVAAMAPDERQRSPRLTALATEPAGEHENPVGAEKAAGAVEPPDPAQPWTAEIEWQDAGGGPRFCLVARPAGGGADALIAASEPLPWPPRDAASVRQMRNEVARIEAALLGSGWSPLASGSAWYSKRFAWAAVVVPVSTGRFRREVDWPADTEDLWRCEIKWKPGYVNSRFTVVTTEPGHRRGKTVGTSEPFKWLLMADPNPQAQDQRAEVRALDEQLVAAGWEPVGRGRWWSALRYVWRHEGPPPDHLEPAEEARHGGHVVER